ncbi:hypothetical protein HXX76_008396 [Chlamydomonas incerta]|uniref:Chitin-binding type-2 domain-containing protein n=1 Tax=Chlamydomonas incerta TaxID=51695 RepID=A0A835W268_CHLIN|nr:hypothetical protein HXX76_008396 [Chlamydomonas incerta]|eukprot:KAG2433331.1 hypothetical protein HXX76_008396 [Chlamydomonas incerta]
MHSPSLPIRRGAHSYGKCCCTVFSKSCCSSCNAGYTDTGCTCYRGPSTIWKKTYDRGVGYPKFRTFVKDSYLDSSTSALRSFAKKTQWRDTKPLVCGPDKDYDGAAICYDKCAAGYTGNSFMCWQNCPANKGLIDCGSYCAPKSAGSCANFIGATYQNCKNKYPARRMVLDMVLSGNYTDQQIQAAAAGDATVFQGPATLTDAHPATVIDYTSQSSVDIAESSGLLLPNATYATRPALIHTVELDKSQHEAAAAAVAPAADSWQHVRIMQEAEGETEDAPIHNRVLQAGAPGSDCVPGDKRASCWCADKDDGVYPDPASTQNRYVICGQGTGVLQRCPVNEVFSATRSRCVHRNEADVRVPIPVAPGSPIPTPPKSCTDRDNGIYFRDSRNITSSYKCDNGVIIPKFCPNGKYLDKASNECKLNPTPLHKPPPPCMDPECFCQDKADRRYVDVLTADPQKYITCANGTGEWGACEQYQQYNRVTGECGFVPPNATEPIADCKGVACFCIGRADGIYTNPWTDKGGINCVAEYGSEIACEPDFKFVVTASPYCQPRNAAEMMRAMNARRDRRLLV